MKRPTRKDAELLLAFYQTFNTPQMRAANNWFMNEFSAKDTDEFNSKYKGGSQEFQMFGDVMTSYEMAGVLVSHGLLNENLYFDVSGIGFVWDKVGHLIPHMQKSAPNLWENAVWLAARQKQWSKKVWKPGLKWKPRTRD